LEIGKKMVRIIKLNRITYTEFIPSIDDKASYGKIAFNIIKGCRAMNTIIKMHEPVGKIS
jgi:hypothetical protein